jgi:hypothetical protein
VFFGNFGKIRATKSIKRRGKRERERDEESSQNRQRKEEKKKEKRKKNIHSKSQVTRLCRRRVDTRFHKR